jgi:hypothetical protein
MQQQPTFYHSDDELDKLNDKINRRFIREVFKPVSIPNSSEVTSVRPFHHQPRRTILSERAPPAITPSPFFGLDPTPTQLPPLQYSNLNCVGVADHTANCPVCKKLYQSSNSAYIVVIILLLIIISVFIKKHRS